MLLGTARAVPVVWVNESYSNPSHLAVGTLSQPGAIQGGHTKLWQSDTGLGISLFGEELFQRH